MSFVDTRTNPDLVEPPARRERSTGLLKQVEVIQETGPSEWEFFGTQWIPLACESDPHVTAPSCAWPSPDNKTFERNEDAVFNQPIYLWRATECETQTALDLKGRALDTLNRFRGQDIEYAFWTGVDNPDTPGAKIGNYLTDGSITGTNVLGSVAQTPSSALSLMMQALASCGGELIHAPIAALPFLAKNNLIVRKDDHIETFDGSFEIVFGHGYSGSSPTNVAPADGTAWIYGTGPMRIRLSEVRVLGDGPDGINRLKNRRIVIAEQSALIELDDCCRFATLMSLETE